MRVELAGRIEIADVFPIPITHRSHRVLIHPSVAAVSCEDALVMLILLATQDGQERAAIEITTRLCACHLETRRQKVDPTHHRIRSRASSDLSWPNDDKRRANPRVVAIPFARRPLGSVVGTEEKKDVLAKLSTNGFVDQAEIAIRIRHRLCI